MKEWREYVESGQAERDHERYIDHERYNLDIWNKKQQTQESDLLLTFDILRSGISIIDLFEKAGLVETRSEMRRLIKQGGAYINGKRIEDIHCVVDLNTVEQDFTISAGKKRRKQVSVI